MKSLGSFIKLTRTALATIDQSINLLQNIKALKVCCWWSRTSKNGKMNLCPPCSSVVIIVDQCWIYFLLKL